VSVVATQWVFEHSPLKGAELLVHLAIADTVSEKYDFEFWASLSTLADKTRTNRNTVRAAVRKMEDAGLLTVVEAERGKSCRYVFNMPNPAPVTRGASVEHPAPECANPAPQTADPAPEEARPRATDAPIPMNVNEPKGTQLARPERFDEFWTAYPRKVGKPTALAKWTKAIRKHNPEDVIAGAHCWAQHWSDAGTEVQYIPHPATWLHREQFNDTPPPIARRNGRAAQSDDAAKSVASVLAGGAGLLAIGGAR